MLRINSLQGFVKILEGQTKKPVELKGVKIAGKIYVGTELMELLKRNYHGSSK